MDLHLNFDLQHLATIAWSASFWNRPNLRDKIYELADKDELREIVICDDIKSLIDIAKAELSNLPPKIYARLIQTIISFGLRIVRWFSNNRRNLLSIPCRFTRAFHWTVFGTVDDAKIFENDWIEQSDTLRKMDEICDVYYMASTSISKGYINLNTESMLIFCQRYKNRLWKFLEGKLVRRKRDFMLRFILRSVLTLAAPERLQLQENEKEQLLKEYFPGNRSRECFMFWLSVEKGHFTAAQYYWDHLTPVEKKRCMMPAAFRCFVINGYRRLRDGMDFSPNNYSDIFVFILKQMPENKREKFILTEEFEEYILRELMFSCAWEEFFFTMFDLIKKWMMNSEFNECLLESIIDVLWKRRKMGLDLNHTVYKNMFIVFWREGNKLSCPDEPFIVFQDIQYLIPKVFEIFDLDIINMMLETFGNRQQFLREGKKQYKELVVKSQFDLLDKFAVNVLKSEDEHKWFTDKINTLVKAETSTLVKKMPTQGCSNDKEKHKCRNFRESITLSLLYLWRLGVKLKIIPRMRFQNL